MRMEDMSESDEDVWESEDDSLSGSEKKSSVDTEEEKEDEFFFEGAEKLLEIWFTTKNQNGNEGDLRSIPRYLKVQLPYLLIYLRFVIDFNWKRC